MIILSSVQLCEYTVLWQHLKDSTLTTDPEKVHKSLLQVVALISFAFE